MALKITKDGTTVVFVLEGTIDGKAAIEAEKAIGVHVTPDVRVVIADMAHVQLLTSAGIRQFLLLRKRMASNRGRLILSAVNDRVRTLLEIAGLLSQFTLVDTLDAAKSAAAGPAAPPPEPPPPESRLGALLFSLLGGQDVPTPADASPNPDVDGLVAHLDRILATGGEPAPDRPRS